MCEDNLKFIVAPHIVQDLGLNLYTSLPRVLVEFVANAYDADSKSTNILLDMVAVDRARAEIKRQWEDEKIEAERRSEGPDIQPLAERTLPETICLEISDTGNGMSRDHLQERFLVAGRRRREVEETSYSENGRLLMGRKGLGKLAGFGVAQSLTVISRRMGESHATKVVLDYDTILHSEAQGGIPVATTTLADGGGIIEKGTRIILSKLLYEPMKSRLSTIGEQLAEHFCQIQPADFEIQMNGMRIDPVVKDYCWAWPEPERAMQDLVEHSYTTEDGQTFDFSYRLRFTKDHSALAAHSRGIRVYAHNRLATAPSLLSADTNMHGFRMTDYLEGAVYADFVDDQPSDYIATDRQALRWDVPALAPMYQFLSEEIKTACYERQKVRDREKESESHRDGFTADIIRESALSDRLQIAAYRISTALASASKRGFDGTEYKEQFPLIIKGMGQGKIIAALAALAKQDKPQLDRVVAEITQLTAEELDSQLRFARTRMTGITALQRIVTSVDFADSNNEGKLHNLLRDNPWLIDPTYFQFLTSNRTKKTLLILLEKYLKIGEHIPEGYNKDDREESEQMCNNKRPDLVFLLGNSALGRLVIVELKAPNTPLHGVHYRQLQGYVGDTEAYLNERDEFRNIRVEGVLIGSHADQESKASEVIWLRRTLSETRNQGQIRVFGIDELLERTERAHADLLAE